MAQVGITSLLPPGVDVEVTQTQWLTPEEFARIMGRKRRTVYEWLQDGTLEAFQIRYVRSRGRVWIELRPQG